MKHLALWKQAGIAALFAIACLSVGWFGNAVAPSGDASPWFRALEKPVFNPPGWLFGVVWPVLYVLMGVAAFLVLREGWERRDVRLALGLFVAQLVLNGLWTPVFFGAESIVGGLVIIVALLVLLAVTIRQFFRVRTLAGWLLVPYILWVGFATVLNLSILVLN